MAVTKASTGPSHSSSSISQRPSVLLTPPFCLKHSFRGFWSLLGSLLVWWSISKHRLDLSWKQGIEFHQENKQVETARGNTTFLQLILFADTQTLESSRTNNENHTRLFSPIPMKWVSRSNNFSAQEREQFLKLHSLFPVTGFPLFAPSIKVLPIIHGKPTGFWVRHIADTARRSVFFMG